MFLFVEQGLRASVFVEQGLRASCREWRLKWPASGAGPWVFLCLFCTLCISHTCLFLSFSFSCLPVFLIFSVHITVMFPFPASLWWWCVLDSEPECHAEQIVWGGEALWRLTKNCFVNGFSEFFLLCLLTCDKPMKRWIILLTQQWLFLRGSFLCFFKTVSLLMMWSHMRQSCWSTCLLPWTGSSLLRMNTSWKVGLGEYVLPPSDPQPSHFVPF